MEIQRLHQIAAHARDLDEAIGFYRDTLGARFIQKFEPPGLAFLDFAGVRVLLERAGPKSTLYLWVDDIDAAYAELRGKGVQFTHPPHRIHRDETGLFGPPHEEEWMAFFSDPSGNVLALATRKPAAS